MAKEQASLNVIARAPFELFYEGPAQIVSAVNKVGPFDILPGHTDFFSMLRPCEVIIDTDTEEIKFKVSNGIVSVKGSEVLLFVNI